MSTEAKRKLEQLARVRFRKILADWIDLPWLSTEDHGADSFESDDERWERDHARYLATALARRPDIEQCRQKLVAAYREVKEKITGGIITADHQITFEVEGPPPLAPGQDAEGPVEIEFDARQSKVSQLLSGIAPK